MLKIVLAHCALLIALGFGLYIAAETKSPTAAIPAFVGLVLAALAALGEATKQRMHFMHAIMGLALLGVLAGLGMGIKTALGDEPAATKLIGMFGLAVVCASLVFAGVRSFKAARLAREAADS